MPSIVLTVADHEAGGFVQLAYWPIATLDECHAIVAAIDGRVDGRAEPCLETAPFWFILDIYEDRYNLVDNGKRLLPTQIAMALAPAETAEWLKTRPNPDDIAHDPIPLSNRQYLERFAQ